MPQIRCHTCHLGPKNSTARIGWSRVSTNIDRRKTVGWSAWLNGTATLNLLENPALTYRKNSFQDTFPASRIFIPMMHPSQRKRKIPLVFLLTLQFPYPNSNNYHLHAAPPLPLIVISLSVYLHSRSFKPFLVVPLFL